MTKTNWQIEEEHITMAIDALEEQARWLSEGYAPPNEEDVDRLKDIHEAIKFFKLKKRNLWTSIN